MFDLVKGNRIRDIGKVFDDSDDIFSRFFGDFGNVFGYNNFQNKEGDLVTEIEIPGFSKENVTVEISDGILTVKGERTTGSGAKQKLFKRLTVGLSEEVNAEIKDGILTLTFKQPKVTKTKVDIK